MSQYWDVIGYRDVKMGLTLELILLGCTDMTLLIEGVFWYPIRVVSDNDKTSPTFVITLNNVNFSKFY